MMYARRGIFWEWPSCISNAVVLVQRVIKSTTHILSTSRAGRTAPDWDVAEVHNYEPKVNSTRHSAHDGAGWLKLPRKNLTVTANGLSDLRYVAMVTLSKVDGILTAAYRWGVKYARRMIEKSIHDRRTTLFDVSEETLGVVGQWTLNESTTRSR